MHPVTKRPMARCPECGHWSGLSGIDGGPCLSCGPIVLDEAATERLRHILAGERPESLAAPLPLDSPPAEPEALPGGGTRETEQQ